ncbi:P1 family peptidase [Roseibacterium sp. SDUM158017]|uniref:P1 family peptidase n=1 Tax=Roseicyclus salinarum TaxID=3036773 RepID=UPI00241530C3|nr:P1 family peptidase [Roseibacterium sp. SDUM158017]MDG4649495.1 P1 family peptidase [Roseibacterium sp. SDUM158017]
MRPGPRNLITDVAGLRVGNAQDETVKTGVTVLAGARPFTAAVHVMGGAPGTRETDLLAPDRTVPEVDAIFLSGGSAFGLDAAQGVSEGLRAQGRGFAVHGLTVPIVPGAIVFDLVNGGDKDWAVSPYPALGRAAFEAASETFALGTAGAGTGATLADLKGGLGSASAVWGGYTVGALVVANPVGKVTVGDGPHFHAAPSEFGDEFGGLGPAPAYAPERMPVTKATRSDREATAIAVVATDAALSKAEATRLAVMAHDGIARAVWPSHAPMDGDVVFAVSTGDRPIRDGAAASLDLAHLGHMGALCLSRAMARAVYHATPAPGDPWPTYRQRFG